MSAVTRHDDPNGERPDQSDQPERRLSQDDPANYAPRWIREGAERPRNVVAMRLPEAPQLAVPPAPPRREEHLVAPEQDQAPEHAIGYQRDPEWPREHLRAPRAAAERPMPAFMRPPEPEPEPEPEVDFEGDRDIRRMWRQQALSPSPVPEPPVRERAGGGLSIGVFLRFGSAIAVAAAAALVVVMVFASPDAGSRTSPFATRTVSQAPVKSAARAGDAWPGTQAVDRGDAVAREAVADEPTRVPTVAISTRPPERVSPRAPEPVTSGVAPVAALAIPPEAERSVAAPPMPVVPPASPPAPVIDAEELARMVKHGEEFVSQGDFAAARLILQRAASAGDARAALVLGATFDPTVLRQLRVMGFKPDVATARSWYQKAAKSGSTEATRRLAALANLGE